MEDYKAGVKLEHSKKRFVKTPEEKRLLIILVLGLIILFIIKNGVYGAINKKYYESIPVILEAKDYYMLTRQDIIDIYGEPPVGATGDAANTYDLGEYKLFFSYENGYVWVIGYTPDEPFKYKNGLKDAFYLFGLGEEADDFKQEDRANVIYRKPYNYANAVAINDIDEKNKTIGEVGVFFQENYSKRPVFEDDFSDIPVIIDLVEYLHKDRNYVLNSLGSDYEIMYDLDDMWYYYTDIGRITIRYDETDIVSDVYFDAKEPMKYENSTQEIMVMFGIDPNLEGMYLADFDNYHKDGYESYENFDGKDSGILISNINSDDKTFKEVWISAD